MVERYSVSRWSLERLPIKTDSATFSFISSGNSFVCMCHRPRRNSHVTSSDCWFLTSIPLRRLQSTPTDPSTGAVHLGSGFAGFLEQPLYIRAPADRTSALNVTTPATPLHHPAASHSRLPCRSSDTQNARLGSGSGSRRARRRRCTGPRESARWAR